MPTYRLVSAIALGAFGTAMACDDFGNDAPPAVDADAGDAGDAGNALVDGSNPDPRDGGNEEDADKRDAGVAQIDGLYPTCPPSSTQSKLSNTIPKVIVRAAAGFDYPFGIVTDTTSIYWVSQYVPANGTPQQRDDAYNGNTKARIHRALKSDGNADTNNSVLVANEKEKTVAITLDGDFIYWASKKDAANAVIRRTPRSCLAPCMPEDWLTVPTGPNVTLLRRARDGLIFAMAEDGKVFRIDTKTKDVKAVNQTTDANPSMAVTTDSAFISWLNQPSTFEITSGSANPHGTFVGGSSPELGGGELATDCDRVYAWRKFDKNVWSTSAKQGGAFVKLADVGQVGAYDMLVDHDYIYVASPDGYGIKIVDLATRKVFPSTYPGSYFRIAVDDSGLYGGEHNHDTPGAIVRFSD